MPRPRNNETREKILQCAYRRFSETDYESIYLKDIAADAGISVNLLHHYFPMKSDLVIHIVYDLLKKASDYLSVHAQDADMYSLNFGTLRLMFDVLSRNRQMLNAYSYIICDTKLMNRVIEFCFAHLYVPDMIDTFAKRYMQYTFFGSVSQVFVLELDGRLPFTLLDAIDGLYDTALANELFSSEEAQKIVQNAEKITDQKSRDDFYESYIQSMDHFIQCDW